MKIVVVGAGQVGEAIASELSADHEVRVVDLDPERVDQLNYSMDVIATVGDGANVESLEAAEIGSADILLAATDDDETNIVTCATAKAISDVFTVARIKNSKYLHTWNRDNSAFGIDLLVATDLLAAESIARVVGLPRARDSDFFGGGIVQMAEFEITDGSPVAGQTVAEADRFDSLTFAAILRDGEVEIPRGDARISGGDKVVVIGSPESVQSFSLDIEPEYTPEKSTEVVIVGGSEIGYQVARLLSEQGLNPRLVEENPERARELAEKLPNVLVMESDATDMGFLQREHIGDADVLVATLESDEKNLLESLLAKRLGIERTIAVIDRPSYVDLFETVGVDVGVNPRSEVAEEITRFTQAGNTENIAFIETDKAEVLEVEIDDRSELAGRKIREAITDFPDGVVIGAITRGGQMIVPRGETVVEVGDHVIALVDIAVIDEVTKKL